MMLMMISTKGMKKPKNANKETNKIIKKTIGRGNRLSLLKEDDKVFGKTGCGDSW